MTGSTAPIDIVLPVHNEGESILATLTEFFQNAKKDGIQIRFVVCEDGSEDNTVEVLKEAEKSLPIHLISSKDRKGYSKAVIDGFKASTSEIVGFIDSDGQCDPKDLKNLLNKLHANSQLGMVMGYRNPRSDHWIRILMSNAFKLVYRIFFTLPVKDPSCPYLVIRRAALYKILSGNVGILKQGFWWEFLARAVALSTRIEEFPVAHRVRSSGVTQVYRPAKVPKIAFEHIIGLAKLKKELHVNLQQLPSETVQ